MAALINGLILVAGSVYILYAAVPRLLRPEDVNEKGMILFAAVGVIVNGVAVLKLRKGKSLNEKVIVLHLFEDVMGWAVVLIMSIVMVFKYIPLLDPVFSILFITFILYRVIINLKKTFSVLLQAVPEGINIEEIERKILGINKIISVHKIHVWSMDSINNVLSAHVVVEDNTASTEIILIRKKIKKIIRALGIEHSTIEIEYESEFCNLRNRDCF